MPTLSFLKSYPNVSAHLRRDGSLKIKQGAYRCRTHLFVRRLVYSGLELKGSPASTQLTERGKPKCDEPDDVKRTTEQNEPTGPRIPERSSVASRSNDQAYSHGSAYLAHRAF
jgi:hypothetical protein